jgi:SAM-dependent methyltransferase
MGKVVGLERDARILAWARAGVTERNLTNVELVQGEASATGLPRESFDLVHERLVLINVPDPERVLSEMIGLARPGGIVAVQEVDWYSWTCEPPHPAWERLLRANEIVQRENGQDLFIGRRLSGLLQAAGLADVGVRAYAHTWRAGDLLQTQLLAFTEIARERIRARGLLTEDELQEAMAQLRPHLDSPTTIVIHPMLFQSWGRKAR